MLDIKVIHVNGGSGGNGCVSFRREKNVSRGGPDGGTGGNGGVVIVQAMRHYRTLKYLSRRRVFRAGSGGPGKGQKKQGKRGEDIVIAVPIGTVVWRVGKTREKEALLADLVEEKQQVIVAEGGLGGRGNTEFVTSTHREPLLAEAGEQGTTMEVLLEVKLLADVGIVGEPNAGKSTLLTTVSRVRPEIAPYPFTTIEPVLGVVEIRTEQVILLEVPGLLRGAHQGRGLGLEFLRHAERTRVLLHLVNGEVGDPVEAYRELNHELACYGDILAAKPQVVVLNKMDLPHVQQRMSEIRQRFRTIGVPLHIISAVTGEGVPAVLGRLMEELSKQPLPQVKQEESRSAAMSVPAVSSEPRVWREDEVIVVSFPQAEKLVALANLRRWEVRVQLHREMERLGVVRALREFGVESGDTVRIGSVELEWE